MTKSSRKGHIENAEAHWVEWLTGGVCTVLVAVLLCWIVWDIWRYDHSDASFDVAIISVKADAGYYRVTFDIHNTSLSTAAEVHVRGDLDVAGKPGESADVTFDYVASESRDTGTLFFRNNPGAGRLDLKVVGYTEP